MSSADNIRNAFHVVYHTYENIHKLMDYCKTVAAEQSDYVSVVDKFLRYKSDTDFSGWFIQNFIILFQNKNNIVFENEWRDGPLYVMELELYNAELNQEESRELPRIRLSKFEYENMQNWASGCSPANHWRFYYPLRKVISWTLKKMGALYTLDQSIRKLATVITGASSKLPAKPFHSLD
ncbi:hypothetical protein ACIQAA_24755 [Neobacillus sp. NPDC093182]|uniref:hypothetical protein n=1 Tax=Neobacillus sp. NPDC093182 TaxID=3364297 RepID=UPI0037FAC910